jgi:acetyltransferase-like isoleucine patch superfamily enzyme
MEQFFNTPILLLIFNRPETTQRVFSAIRQAKPKQLFVAADGPRSDCPDDQNKCAAARAIIKQVDWDCEVKTLFQEKNLGCGKGPATAISWFFENVTKGIILEDDCLPARDFFIFCEAMLNQYENENKIWAICGTNVLTQYPGSGEFIFSLYGGNTGWATWRRAWVAYSYSIENELSEEKNWQFIASQIGQKRAKSLRLAFKGLVDCPSQNDVWDFQWFWRRLLNEGACIVPRANMITNIGFAPGGTHITSSTSPLANLPHFNLAHPLTFPGQIIIDHVFDEHGHKLMFGNSLLVRIEKKINTALKRFSRIGSYFCVKIFIAKNRLFFLINKFGSHGKVLGSPKIFQPITLSGRGFIGFGDNVSLGIIESPYLFDRKIYLSARTTNSSIVFGKNIYVNNGLSIISNGYGITIKDNVLFGFDVTIIDSDFHLLDPQKRMDPESPGAPIVIGNNVFIGSHCRILKGVTIGDNAVIGLGSVVTADVAANSVFAGNPAKFIKKLV